MLTTREVAMSDRMVEELPQVENDKHAVNGKDPTKKVTKKYSRSRKPFTDPMSPELHALTEKYYALPADDEKGRRKLLVLYGAEQITAGQIADTREAIFELFVKIDPSLRDLTGPQFQGRYILPTQWHARPERRQPPPSRERTTARAREAHSASRILRHGSHRSTTCRGG
jgi:hypothetical protein